MWHWEAWREKYSWSVRGNIRIESRHKRAALGARERGLSFISYARRIIVREQRGYKFPPFKFQIRFFPGNLGRARARITFGAPLPALIGPADRFGMECSTYFLSFARKNLTLPPGWISTTSLNLRHDESMASLRDRRRAVKGRKETKPKQKRWKNTLL